MDPQEPIGNQERSAPPAPADDDVEQNARDLVEDVRALEVDPPPPPR